MNIFIPIAIGTAGEKLRKKVTDVVNGTVKMVDYLDGFQTEARGSRTPKQRRSHKISNSEQYAGEVLQFFPHPEGYVKASPTNLSLNSPPTGYIYNYVYNYTDHLGNVRLSYSKNPATNQLNILEENHYYPFGLKHEVYISGGKRDYRAIPDDNEPRLIGVTQTDYQYKYQGQERQDELGLNWDSFKWRNYDYAIGRFMSIDKLSEDYNWQTVYAFSENRVIDGVEMEGLERVSFLSVGAFQGNNYAAGAVYDIDQNTVKVGVSIASSEGPINIVVRHDIDKKATSIDFPASLDINKDLRQLQGGFKISPEIVNTIDDLGIFDLDKISENAHTNIYNGFIESGLSVDDSNFLTDLIVGNIRTIVDDVQSGKAELLYQKEEDTFKTVTDKNGNEQIIKFSDGSNWTVKYKQSDGSLQLIQYTDYENKDKASK